jgi:hypothetical protein
MVLGYTTKNGKAQLFCDQPLNLDKCVPLLYAARHMSGSLCGLSPGSTTQLSQALKSKVLKKVYGWGLRFLAWLTSKLKPSDPDFAAPSYPERGNDGMVGFNSCRAFTFSMANYGRREYADDPTSFYYAFRGNHADGTCRNGDISDDKTRQSCAWVGNMMQEGIRSRTEFRKNGGQVDESNGYLAAAAREMDRIKRDGKSQSQLDERRREYEKKQREKEKAQREKDAGIAKAANDDLNSAHDLQKKRMANKPDIKVGEKPPAEVFIELSGGDVSAGMMRFRQFDEDAAALEESELDASEVESDEEVESDVDAQIEAEESRSFIAALELEDATTDDAGAEEEAAIDAEIAETEAAEEEEADEEADM